MPGYPPLVVHSTNALKKPQLLNSNRKRKNPLLKHLWLLDQRPTGPMKQNKNILPHTLNPKPLDGISLTQNLNQENNASIFLLNVKTATRNYRQWEPAFHSKKNMKIILVITMIFDLVMALINRATKEDVCQMKEAEYIEYTMELAGFNYEDEVEVYHQIASHTYSTQEAQIQRLEQMNIRLCEEYIMPCNEQWCLECYALSIPLSSKNDENKIEFGELKATEEIETTPIYLIKNQPALQLKYFNNNRQGIKPKKAHEIDAGYDLRYPGKDTLVLKPKSLTKINLKIALKIPPGAMVQITSQSSLASKGINVRGGIINARYTGDITVMLQNETDKPFKIEHAEKIAQAIYLPLINISGLQLVNQREQLGKSDRGTQGFGSTGRFTVPLKELIAEFANIFTENNNDLGRTNLVQHQIYTGDAKPRRQQAY
ncbi:hypothetical protein G9A89_021046 [Geosiphon pyriformis]|nr:hypothetical protein G9A89_021046 [Geosiphon pyriformis]